MQSARDSVGNSAPRVALNMSEGSESCDAGGLASNGLFFDAMWNTTMDVDALFNGAEEVESLPSTVKQPRHDAVENASVARTSDIHANDASSDSSAAPAWLDGSLVLDDEGVPGGSTAAPSALARSETTATYFEAEPAEFGGKKRKNVLEDWTLSASSRSGSPVAEAIPSSKVRSMSSRPQQPLPSSRSRSRSRGRSRSMSRSGSRSSSPGASRRPCVGALARKICPPPCRGTGHWRAWLWTVRESDRMKLPEKPTRNMLMDCLGGGAVPEILGAKVNLNNTNAVVSIIPRHNSVSCQSVSQLFGCRLNADFLLSVVSRSVNR